jgi:hypothetical protein
MTHLQRRALATGLGLVAILLASFALQRYTSPPAREEQSLTVGAEWERNGWLSEKEYVRLRGLGQSVVQTNTISDQDLDWALARMQQSSSSIVHARVLGVLDALRNPPASQKARVKKAIAPLLQSRDVLDRRYAYRVQNTLALYR